LINFDGVYVKIAFFGNGRLRPWRKMNSYLSGNLCRQARISAVPILVEKPGFFNELLRGL